MSSGNDTIVLRSKYTGERIPVFSLNEPNLTHPASHKDNTKASHAAIFEHVEKGKPQSIPASPIKKVTGNVVLSL